MTTQEIKDTAIQAALTGFVASAGTVVNTDTILQAIQKLAGTISAATSNNNLFNYYNFI